MDEIYNYKSYRKLFNPWIICDYKMVALSFEDYVSLFYGSSELSAEELQPDAE